MKKIIPKFKSEDKERDFWATADSTEYIDWEKPGELFFRTSSLPSKKSPCAYLN